jgi:GT2 family glycosyltransferase
MKNSVSVVLICYNSKKFLPRCLGSLTAQTWHDLDVILVDNNSTDGACAYARQSFPRIITVENSVNLGYAAAANQGIRLAKSEFVMVLNPDIILEPGYIEKCVGKMKEDEKIGAITGKLYRYDFEHDKKTNVIDTVGLLSFRNRRIIDEGQGLEDKGQFNEPREVFGVSGACPMYRKSALTDCKNGSEGAGGGEYFDEDFFMYKEDVDLSWRLRLFGWKCFYLPAAVGYHGRGTGVLKRFTHLEVLKNRSKLNRFQKYHSYKNQRLMQLKNEFVFGFLCNFFPIIWKEILIKGYMIFREPYLFKACLKMFSLLPRALKKRKYIMKNRRAGWREMEKWLSGNKRTARPDGY